MVEEKQEGGRILTPPPGKIGLKVSLFVFNNKTMFSFAYCSILRKC